MSFNASIYSTTLSGNTSKKIDISDCNTETTQSLSSNSGLKVNNLQKKPGLWVREIPSSFTSLNRMFQLRALPPSELEVGNGEHFILADDYTKEADVKAVGWRVQQAGGFCFVRRLSTRVDWFLEDLAKQSSVEILNQIDSEFSQSFDDWVEQTDNKELKPREARLIAKAAIEILPENEAESELNSLQARVAKLNYNSWNQFINKEKLAKNKDNPERLKLEIQRYISEPEVRERLKIKQSILGLFNFHISNSEFKELINSFEVANKTSKPKMYNPAEFMKLESEGLRWLIPGLLPAVGITLLAGAPGVGKSTLAYDAAACILFGEDFLGETPTKPGKVLFVASDELPTYVQDKFVNRGIFGSNNWQILLDWNISQISELEKQIEDFRPDLVIIDSFASIHKDDAFDENSSKADKGVRQLEALVNKYSTAGVIIHHAGKNKENSGTVNAVRGSSAISAAASFVWLLDGVKDSDVRMFATPKSRGTENQKLPIKLIGQDGRWERCTPLDTQVKTLGDRILDFLNSQPVGVRFEGIEIINALGSNDKSIYKALDRLVQRGLVTKRPSTVDPKRRVYGLSKKSTPPSPLSSQTVSTKILETFTTQDLEVSRHLVDNEVDNSRQPTLSTNDVYNAQNIIQSDFERFNSTVDTHSRQGGGGVIFSDSLSSDDTNLNVAESTSKSVTNFIEQDADKLRRCTTKQQYLDVREEISMFMADDYLDTVLATLTIGECKKLDQLPDENEHEPIVSSD